MTPSKPVTEARNAARRSRRLVGPTLLCLALFLYAIAFQGSRGLWERDEGRYTNIALQMLRSGDFLKPAFNDDVHHFAKPPLTYWAVAAGIKLLGRNEWGARLPNALAFIGTVLVLYALGKGITPEKPWLPALVYSSSLLPIGAANFVTTDTLLTLWEALAVLGFVRWRSHPERPSLPLFLMWLGFALAFLTKGPPGLLPLLVIAGFVFFQDGWKGLPRLVTPSGLAVFIVLGLGWYLIVVAIDPRLAGYFLKDEVIGRVASGASFNRNASWYGAFVVYVPTLIAGTLPWTLVLLRKVRSVPGTLLSRRWWRVKLIEDPWGLFLLLWLLIPLFVFFVSRSRLPLYLLPLFVPLALITSKITVALPFQRKHTCLILVWLLALVAARWVASLYPYPGDSRRIAQAITEAVSPNPSELVFVDAYPIWGLGFYLNCEVEQVLSRSEPTPTETLNEELSNSEPGTLLVSQNHDKNRLMGLLTKSGFDVAGVAEAGKWSFISKKGEFHWRQGTPVVLLETPNLENGERVTRKRVTTR